MDAPFELDETAFDEVATPALVGYSGDNALPSPSQDSTTNVPSVRDIAPTRVGIINYIEENFIVPIREGRLSIKRARGQYDHSQVVMRTKLAEDLVTIAHELGHHLTHVFDLDPHDVKYASELQQLGAQLYPKYPDDEQRNEGLAEFFRLYFTNTTAAKQAAPKWYTEFDYFLGTEKKLNRQVKELQRMYRQHINATGAAHVEPYCALPRDEQENR